MRVASGIPSSGRLPNRSRATRANWLQFNMSVAVGFIALAGVAAETGVVMLIYLDHALTETSRMM
jgi:Cu/Ag efflux pump CusA